MRDRPGRHALWVGLIISCLAHLLLLRLNPALELVITPRYSPPQSTSGEPARLIPLRITTSSDAAPARATTASPAPSPSAMPAATSQPPTAGPPAPDARGDVDVSAADRLTYRPGSIWARPAPRLETEAECRKRELTERLERGIADKDYAKLPSNPSRTFGMTIRIPFGKKPPPPPHVVPAPLPDSLRGRTPGGDSPWAKRDTGAVEVVRRPAGCGEPIFERTRSDTLPH